MQFLQTNGLELLNKTWEHLYISMIAVVMGIIVAVPLGIIMTRMKRGAGIILGVVNVLQTLPSLAVLAFFIPILGIGKLPAIVALFLYSVLPILRNTFLGIKGVNRDLLESGRGLGMTGFERVRMLELPLSAPIIMAGIRTSSVYLIGWATLASFIGGGGLGDYIFIGLNLYRPDYIIAGAIPVTIIAVLVDYLFMLIEKKVTPKGIRMTEGLQKE
ncbi:ABC transporter permease [Sporolactobacillus sp. Y61]|uniref:ABC transporter permease n=1 Tax=Sporolactobacillus sp. Y61 TaxID=3160863 RepID=A0AAU8IJW5_9BACL|nr:ABC transporter permease [Sporolactobacillus sp. THM19-2]